jgi:hypothetical protein
LTRVDFAAGLLDRANLAGLRAFAFAVAFLADLALAMGRLAERRRAVRFRAFLAAARAFLAFRLAMTSSFPTLTVCR